MKGDAIMVFPMKANRINDLRTSQAIGFQLASIRLRFGFDLAYTGTPKDSL